MVFYSFSIKQQTLSGGAADRNARGGPAPPHIWINEKVRFQQMYVVLVFLEQHTRLRDLEGLHVSSKNSQGSKTEEGAGGTEGKTVS